MWQTDEDLEKDLEAYDEICPKIEAPRDPPPPTILEYKARIGANQEGSIYDPIPIPNEEDGILVNRGRGRGGFQIYTPGISNYTNSKYDDVEEDIRRRLKEIAVVGYSNEAIEQNYWNSIGRSAPRRKYGEYKEFCDAKETKLTTVSPKKLENPSDKVSTKNYSPYSRSATMSEESLNSLSVRTNENLSLSSGHSSPVIIEEIQEEKREAPTPDATQAPLPLSVMLNLAKKNRKRAESQGAIKKDPSPNLEKENKQVAVNGLPSDGKVNGHSYNNSSSKLSKPWWGKSGSETDSDEPLSWRKKTNSPPKFFNNSWNTRYNKKHFDLENDEDFPAL